MRAAEDLSVREAAHGGAKGKAHGTDGQQNSRQGVAGLIFAVGFMVLILVAVPAARWLFVLALPAGVLVGGVLCLWHSRSR